MTSIAESDKWAVIGELRKGGDFLSLIARSISKSVALPVARKTTNQIPFSYRSPNIESILTSDPGYSYLPFKSKGCKPTSIIYRITPSPHTSMGGAMARFAFSSTSGGQ